MPFAIKVGEDEFRIEDIDLADLGKIAKDAGLPSWTQLLYAPGLDAFAAEALLRFVHEKAGVAAPEHITPRVLADAIVEVPDDLPEAFEGGIPKPEGDPATT